jgi:phosphate transport system permease protein
MNAVPSATSTPRSPWRRPSGLDPFHGLCAAAAVACVVLLVWIAIDIGWQAWPAIRVHGVSLLASSDWNPNGGRYGILGYLLGTLASSFIAIAVALPLGVMIAIFLSEDFLPPALRQTFRFLVELLASIPSVVYGLWGIAVVVPWVQSWGGTLSGHLGGRFPLLAGPSYAYCMLAASLVLALMILPTITAISRNALQAVPPSHREICYAVGFTRWEAIGRILLPTAAPGIVASAVLALGRAMGETMAVAMLIGNSSRLSWSLLSPAGTLAGLLANQFAEAEGMVVGVLMYAAVLLMLMTLLVNLAGDWILKASQRRMKGLA